MIRRVGAIVCFVLGFVAMAAATEAPPNNPSSSEEAKKPASESAPASSSGGMPPGASAPTSKPADPSGAGATTSSAGPAPVSPRTTAEDSHVPNTMPAPQNVQEARPPLYYLKDKDGNLVPVPGFRLEDFEEMVKRQYGSGPADQVPRYSLQSLEATGTVKGDHAELAIHAKFVIHEEGWTRVPLRFDHVLLRDEAQYRGPGQRFLQFESGGDGYVLWVRGGSGQEHEVTLDVLVPVVRVGDESRLRLVAPRAAASGLKLTVPMAGAIAKVSEGSTLLPPSPTAGGGTLLSVVGLGGDFELAWGKAEGRPVETQAVLEASGAVQMKVNGRGLDTDVRLTVRAFGGAFDSFQVRLPKKAQLVPGKNSAYTVSPGKSSDPGADGRRLVDVRLPKKTSGPVEVQFTTRLPLDLAGSQTWADVASYEVVGAARQSGQVALRADNQWRVLVGPLRGVRQVDELPRPLRSDDMVAGFEYFAQPCTLPIRVVRRSPRVSVEPEYLLLVDSDQVTLEGKLKYMVRAAEVGTFDIDLPGWELDEVGPENLVASDAIVDQSGLRSIPLTQRSIGPIELSIRAHRKIPAGSKSISVELPRPRADSQASAAVVVLPADNVELTPTPDAMTGLVRQQVAPQMKLPERQQDPLFYRAEPTKATFAAGFRIHSQKVSVGVVTEITVDEQRAEVQQRFSYLVAHKPIDRLTFDVPRSLSDPQLLTIRFEGKPLVPADLPDPNDQPDLSAPSRKQVILPASRIGVCEVLIQYQVDYEKLLPRSSIAAAIPLVMPCEGELTGNQVLVTSKEGIRVRQREGPWKEAEAGVLPPAVRQGLQFVAAGRTGEITLAIHLADQSSAGSTVVGRAWVQTWLTQSFRQDRAVFLLTTTQKSLDLVVPAGVNPADVELWLDGKRVSGQSTPEGRVIVAIAGPESQHEHRVEAIYRFTELRPGPGRIALELPRLGHDVWVHRFYWQVVLPPNEHILGSPADFTGEYHWGFNGLFWGRLPALDQAQLETWSGARHLAELPGESNRYLFSSLGTVNRCELRTADRTLIVFTASAVALMVGLVLIYVPASRHPASLLVLAVMLAASAVAWPAPSVLLAQASGLGVVLSLAAWWLQRGVLRRRRLAAVRDISSSFLERSSTRAPQRVAGLGNDAATEIMPDAMVVSSVDSEP